MIDATTLSVLVGLAIALAIALASFRPALIVDHPRTVLALAGLVSLGSIAVIVDVSPLADASAPRLRIQLDPSSESLIPAEDPGKDIYRDAVLNFGSDDVYVIAMETEEIFSYESLQSLRRVTDAIRRLPGVRDAASLVNVFTFRYDPEEDFIDIRQFIDEIPEDPVALAELRREALGDPIFRKTMVSDDGRATAVNVTFQAMTDGEFVALDLDGRIEAILETESGGERNFFVTGRPHIRAQGHHLMVNDLVTLIPLAILVAALVGAIMTSSRRGVLIPLTSCLTATLWTFGFLALIEVDLNVITLVLGPTLICIGSVYGVHVMGRYETIAMDAPDSYTAALHTLEYTRLPVLMAGFTTCVGFGALLLADVPATNELGAFSVLGVAAVSMLSLTAVPAVLSILPLERERRGIEGRPLYEGRRGPAVWIGKRMDQALGLLAGAEVDYPMRFILGWGVATVLAVVLIPRIIIDTDFLTFFRVSSPVRTQFDAVDRLLTGAGVVFITFNGDEEGTFREPVNLRALREVQRELERVEGVDEVLSLVDFVTVIHGALEGTPPDEVDVPATRAATAEMIFMIPKDQLRRFATSNHSSANLVVRTGTIGSRRMRQLEERIRKVVSAGALAEKVDTQVTGNTILLNKSADGVAGNQALTVGSAAFTIFVLMWVVFRSLRLALVAMIPNITPVLIFYGVLGLGAAPLSLPTSLIGAITLGIAIDDTVHFLNAYQRERAKGHEPHEAAAHCVRTVGRPIVITSVMLFVGFNVLLLSEFATLGQFGYLAAMTMAVCLSTDIGLLPALVVRARA